MLKPVGSNSLTQITQTESAATEAVSPQTTPQTTAMENPNSTETAKSFATARFKETSISGNFMAFQLQSQVPVGKTTPPNELALGSNGPQVEQFQNKLNEWRANNGMAPIEADGKFGPETEAAVRDFQRKNSLKEDGIAGPNTKFRMELENAPEFQSLDPSSQAKLRNCSNDPALHSQLMSFVKDAPIGELSQSHRDQVVDAFVKNPEHSMKLVGVYGNDIFRKMDDATKTRVLDMGIKNGGNETYAKDLNDLMATAEMYEASNPARKKMLDDFEISHSPMATHPQFHALDDDSKKKLGEMYLAWKDDPVKAQNLPFIVADAALEELTPSQRATVLQGLEQNPAGWMKMVGVYGNDSFRKSDPQVQNRLLEMAARNSGDETYMKDLNDLMASPEMFEKNNAQRQKLLDDFEASHINFL